MRRAVAAAVVLWSVTDPSVAAALPVTDDHACMGQWVGRGRNTGFSTYWTIDLTLTAAPDGGRCGTIEYTNPRCGGTLESCRVVDGDIHTREVYTHSDSDCAPAGRVIIRCEGERMRYSWIGWERVDSILHRPGASGPSGGTQPSPSGGGGGTQPDTPGPAPSPPHPGDPSPGPTPSVEDPAPPPLPSLPGQPPAPTEESSGCGCDATALAAPGAWPMLALLFLVARRRRQS